MAESDEECPECGQDGKADYRAVRTFDVMLANMLRSVLARFTLTPIPGTTLGPLETQIRGIQTLDGGCLFADLLAEAIGLERNGMQ